MNIAEEIAKVLFEAGIRLKDESDLLALSEADKETRYKIVSEYRKWTDNDFEVTFNMRMLPDHAHNVWELIYETIYADFQKRVNGHCLSDEVDEALWIMQEQDSRERHEDDLINRYKDKRIALPAFKDQAE